MLQEAISKNCPDIRFTLADNGAILLGKLKTTTAPDFIILDINMPKLNGKECLKAIRSKPAFKAILVMMYSTTSDKDDIEESFVNGADSYVVKPNSVTAINKLASDICNGTIKSSLERN